MIEVLIKAFGLALVLIFMIGPVFFSLVQTGIESGFSSGAVMAVGVAIADATYIIISYFGLANYLAPYSDYMGPVGGTVFIIFGLYSILKTRTRISYSNEDQKKSGLVKFLAKGFLINAASPFVIVFWLATVSAITAQYSSEADIFLFFGSAVLFVFIGDLIKVGLANRLKRLVTVRFIRIMNFIVGLILIGVGIRLLFIIPEF